MEHGKREDQEPDGDNSNCDFYFEVIYKGNCLISKGDFLVINMLEKNYILFYNYGNGIQER